MKPKLNYVFQVLVQSCSNPEEWVERLIVRQSNECKSSPQQIAANIACHHLKLESGIKVEFLGLQDDTTNGGKHPQQDKPITRLNPFFVCIMRTV